jgi:hypothetical protein
MKQVISEQEKNRIKSLYGVLPKEKDFVFDMVLTENNKYLIIMDQVFVAGGNGNSIGSIWENTHIFNEIIKESLGTINESVSELIDNIVWEKELVTEWLKDKTVITEGLWDDITSGVSNVASKIGNYALETAKTIFNKGVLPALRWVRRGLYTGVGIVIDVMLSILAAKSNAIVWFVIVLLDIYEIVTGDFDPQDPDRMQLPFFFLFADLLGCIFTGATALAARKLAPAIAKNGLAKAAPQMVKPMETLAQKIPTLQGQLAGVATTLGNKLGPSSVGVIGKIKNGIARVLTQFKQFIEKLFTVQNAKAAIKSKPVAAAATGVAVWGASELAGKGLASLDSGGKMGEYITKFDSKAKEVTGLGQYKITQDEDDAIMASLARINQQGNQ